jgi:uncharacterized protein YbjT (DUF2867 family)
VLKEGPSSIPAGQSRRTREAAYRLLTTPGHEGKIYAMSGPEALSMAEVAEQISLAVGTTVRYVSITREERKQALRAAGVPSFSVDALDAQAGERLKGMEATVHPETHTAPASAFHGRCG